MEMTGVRVREGQNAQDRGSVYDRHRQDRADRADRFCQWQPAVIGDGVVDQRDLSVLDYPTGQSFFDHQTYHR